MENSFPIESDIVTGASLTLSAVRHILLHRYMAEGRYLPVTELCSGSITTDLIRVQCPVDGNAFWTNKTKVSSQITSLFWLTFIGKADGMCSYEGTGLKVR